MSLSIELYDSKEKCCGCEACYNVCKKQAIEMIPDEEGFLYPKIDVEKCVGCGVCLSVCPFRIYNGF